jgi:predicted phosphodiesterase
MKVLIISDVHANLDALRAVFGAAGECEGLLCLGDVIGYGPDAEACARAIRGLESSFAKVTILSGNHDAGLSGSLPLSWFNPRARRSVEITRDTLSADSRAWLATLRDESDLDAFSPRVRARASHGSPVEPLTGYLWGGLETSDALKLLRDGGIALGFCGHTHVVSVFDPCSEDERYPFPPSGTVVSYGGERSAPLIVNPGSVGFPRSLNEGNVELSVESYPAFYAIWDTDAETVTLRYARYDRRPVERRIAEAGL